MNSNILFANKKLFIVIVVLVVILVGLVLLRVVFQQPAKDSILPSFKPSPSPYYQSPSYTPYPSQSVIASPSNIPVNYNLDNLKKDYERIVEKEPLPRSDLQVRQQLIGSIGNKSGIIEETNENKIEYVKAPDSFMVEILTIDVESAKTMVGDFFANKGLSPSGICYLPVVFYLSPNVHNYFMSNKMNFNPLPKGCE